MFNLSEIQNFLKNPSQYVKGSHRPSKPTPVQLRLNKERFWSSSKENGRNLGDSIDELWLVSCSDSFFLMVNRKKRWSSESSENKDRELSRLRPALNSEGKTFNLELSAACKRSIKRPKQTERKIVLEVSADFQGSHPISSEASLSFHKDSSKCLRRACSSQELLDSWPHRIERPAPDGGRLRNLSSR